MNHREIMQLIKQMREQFKRSCPSKSDEEIDKMILDVFFKAYCEDKMDREDLTTLTNALGYGINKEILDEIEREKRGGK